MSSLITPETPSYSQRLPAGEGYYWVLTPASAEPCMELILIEEGQPCCYDSLGERTVFEPDESIWFAGPLVKPALPLGFQPRDELQPHIDDPQSTGSSDQYADVEAALAAKGITLVSGHRRLQAMTQMGGSILMVDMESELLWRLIAGTSGVVLYEASAIENLMEAPAVVVRSLEPGKAASTHSTLDQRRLDTQADNDPSL